MRYLFLGFVLLAGCATPEQRAEQALVQFGPYCDKIGYQRDTDQWRNCITQQAAERSAAGRAAYQASQQNRPKTCMPNGIGGVTCN